jgi:putative zinc finger protein
MTSQLMNHKEANSRLAAERYLLGEMQEEERAAFEEHFLNCAECLDAVTFGDEFMQAAQPVARELRVAERTAPEPGSLLKRVLTHLWHPAPAWAMAAVLALGVLNIYQVTVVQKQKNVIAELKAPKQEFRFTVSGQARSEQGPAFHKVRPDQQITIKFEFKPGHTQYQAEISSADGKVKWVKPLALPDYESATTISLPAEALTEGRYSAVLRAQTPSGSQDEVASGSFELKFVK